MSYCNIIFALVILAATLRFTQGWHFGWGAGKNDEFTNKSELDKVLDASFKGCLQATKNEEPETCFGGMISELSKGFGESLMRELVKKLHLEDLLRPSKAKNVNANANILQKGKAFGAPSSGLGDLLKVDTVKTNIVQRNTTLSELGQEKLQDFASAFDTNAQNGMLKILKEAQSMTEKQLTESSPLIIRGNPEAIANLSACFIDKVLSIREEFFKLMANGINIFDMVCTIMNLKTIYDQVLEISSTVKRQTCVGSSTGSLRRFVNGQTHAAISKMVNFLMEKYSSGGGGGGGIDSGRITEVTYRLVYYVFTQFMIRLGI